MESPTTTNTTTTIPRPSQRDGNTQEQETTTPKPDAQTPPPSTSSYTIKIPILRPTLTLTITWPEPNKWPKAAFKQTLLDAYNLIDPEHERWIWCPLLGWQSIYTMRPLHLFPDYHGQDAMDAILGKADPPELFSPQNGLMLSVVIEAYIEGGQFVIVPDVPENSSSLYSRVAELVAWIRRNEQPREYKLRVIDPEFDHRDKPVFREKPPTWNDLDGRRLEFRNGFRPDIRDVYWHFCMQMVVRRAWRQNDKVDDVLRDGAGRLFWDLPGRYLPGNMLAVLVGELGVGYEGLLDGAGRKSGDDDDDALLEAAARQVRGRHKMRLRKMGYDFEARYENDLYEQRQCAGVGCKKWRFEVDEDEDEEPGSDHDSERMDPDDSY